MHILVAPNAFKNALTAEDAAKYIIDGLTRSKLKFTATNFPIGDGGDGTGALLIKKSHALIISTIARNPFGEKINATFGLTDDGTAIIELADVCGLRLIKQNEFGPLHAATYGAGDLIKAALDKNAKLILLCIGGSCTIDGGTGILQSLGVKFLDIHNRELQRMPESLAQLDKIDLSNLDKRIKNIELIIICDVENKLLGENGAAAIFGPQKGATKNDIEKLEIGLTKFSEVVFAQTGIDMAILQYGGAAGGVAAGFSALLNARLVNGANYFLDHTHFNHELGNADLVITGEGKLDEQTLLGKAPYAVALRAKQRKIPVIGVAGKIPDEAKTLLEQYFDMMFCINDEPVEISTALKQTPENLVQAAEKIGNLLASAQSQFIGY